MYGRREDTTHLIATRQYAILLASHACPPHRPAQTCVASERVVQHRSDRD
jgi:hypothetical protein